MLVRTREDAVQIAVGTIIAGKYQLEAPLARGGMGSVWVARHVKLASRLAVKFLDPRFADAPAFIDRFEREARAAAALQSPHVVHVQDYGLEEGTPYLVMELLHGEDLAAKLNRERRLPLPDTSRILLQIGKALRKAHVAGIVHRDLKPANVFLARVDDDEVVKILDFGIAKETQSQVGEATKTGETMGSPHYMSPEQARADKGIDHRADLWSLGVILYRMVTGVLPFPGEVIGAVLSRILVDPVPPVGDAAPDLPVSLDAFFGKALAKAKENRFQSIQEMIDAFAQVAGGPLLLATGYALPRVSASEIEAPLRVAPEDQVTLLLPSPGGQAGAQAISGAGVATTTNMVREPEARARRRSASWIVGVALAAVIGGCALLAWTRLQPGSESAGGGVGTTATPPAGSALFTSGAPNQPSGTPIQESPSGAAEPGDTTISTSAAPAPTGTAPANTTAEPTPTGAPTTTATTAPQRSATPRSSKPAGTERPAARPPATGTKKTGDEWGF